MARAEQQNNWHFWSIWPAKGQDVVHFETQDNEFFVGAEVTASHGNASISIMPSNPINGSIRIVVDWSHGWFSSSNHTVTANFENVRSGMTILSKQKCSLFQELIPKVPYGGGNFNYDFEGENGFVYGGAKITSIGGTAIITKEPTLGATGNGKVQIKWSAEGTKRARFFICVSLRNTKMSSKIIDLTFTPDPLLSGQSATFKLTAENNGVFMIPKLRCVVDVVAIKNDSIEHIDEFSLETRTVPGVIDETKEVNLIPNEQKSESFTQTIPSSLQNGSVAIPTPGNYDATIFLMLEDGTQLDRTIRNNVRLDP